MLQKNNFLLLDEPTNHLDIDSKEMLELSLEDYEGTVFFISHDRYFIDKIATRILEVTPHGVVSYLGNYSDYIEKKQQLAELEATKLAEQSELATANNVTDYQKQKEQRRLEQQRKRQLEDTEAKIAAYEEDAVDIQKSRPIGRLFYDKLRSSQTSIASMINSSNSSIRAWTCADF